MTLGCWSRVLDAGGKPINNSPPVTLTIVKGPGEFPTGPSIAFENRSDIRILDGQAAMTLRSYYAGDTIVRATSPGLAPAEVTLHFVGPVAYEEGKTPPVEPRAYVRVERQTRPGGREHARAPLADPVLNLRPSAATIPLSPAARWTATPERRLPTATRPPTGNRPTATPIPHGRWTWKGA